MFCDCALPLGVIGRLYSVIVVLSLGVIGRLCSVIVLFHFVSLVGYIL